MNRERYAEVHSWAVTHDSQDTGLLNLEVQILSPPTGSEVPLPKTIQLSLSIRQAHQLGLRLVQSRQVLDHPKGRVVKMPLRAFGFQQVSQHQNRVLPAPPRDVYIGVREAHRLGVCLVGKTGFRGVASLNFRFGTRCLIKQVFS